VSRSDDGETSSTVKIMAAAKNDEEIWREKKTGAKDGDKLVQGKQTPPASLKFSTHLFSMIFNWKRIVLWIKS
jgi:hypothetical protein